MTTPKCFGTDYLVNELPDLLFESAVLFCQGKLSSEMFSVKGAIGYRNLVFKPSPQSDTTSVLYQDVDDLEIAAYRGKVYDSLINYGWRGAGCEDMVLLPPENVCQACDQLLRCTLAGRFS